MTHPAHRRLWNALQKALRRWRREAPVTATGPGGPKADASGAALLPAPATRPLKCATVVIPALNEASHIGDVVRHALADPATAQVIVVDDCSIDDTAALAREAGAEVITSSMLGKGASMRDGALAARCDWVVYLDGDLSGLRPQVVSDLCRPLLSGEADFVKARFGRTGGRVTELTAKPMLKVFFPELASFAQPLGGVIAARASLLRGLNFEDGWGVDIGLLLDAQRAGARLGEVDIGTLQHDSQALMDLTAMANEVSRVIFERARRAGRLHMAQIEAMYEVQRQATATLEYVLTRRRGRHRVMLLDMDGTITSERYVVALARAAGQEAALSSLLDGPDDAATRSERIAALFRFVHRRQFEAVAHAMPIRPGAVEAIHRLRRAGFMVGVVSDSWFIAADIMRRRVFADFALAHTLQFEAEVCQGEVRLNAAFQPLRPSRGAPACKRHVVQRIREEIQRQTTDAAAAAEVWAMGDNVNDLGMLREADRAFVIDPKHPTLARDADALRIDGFEDFSAWLAEQPQGEESTTAH